MDLVADRTRTVNRLRAQFFGIFPGLERALDLTNTGPLTLLAPGAIRRLGAKRLETWLHHRHVVRAEKLAETAVQAAERQHTSLPGEKLTAQMVRTLAREVLGLNQQVAELDKAIEARFREHHDFDVITSMPGLGVILGAEFLAATGGDMTTFGTPDRLAGFARSPATQARSAATCGAPRDTTAASNASSTPRRCPASATARNPGASTIANVPKASAIPRPSWLSLAAASMSSGPFCATDGATSQLRRQGLPHRKGRDTLRAASWSDRPRQTRQNSLPSGSAITT